MTKEVKGELTIVSVKLDHPAIINVESYKTVANLAKQTASLSTSSTSTSLAVSTNTSPPAVVITIQDYLKPTTTSIKELLHLISSSPDEIQNLYTPRSLKSIFITYLTSAALIHPRDPKYFILNEPLVAALLKKEEAMEFMEREEGARRLANACQEWYGITFSNEGNKGEELRKGKSPKILIKLKSVGKRMVTLISGTVALSLRMIEGMMSD